VGEDEYGARARTFRHRAGEIRGFPGPERATITVKTRTPARMVRVRAMERVEDAPGPHDTARCDP
jgi:hypothetical protein